MNSDKRIICLPTQLEGAKLDAEWNATAAFATLVAPGEVRRAGVSARRALNLAVYDGASELIASDPILIRMIVRTFHPGRSDPAVWVRFREFSDDLQHVAAVALGHATTHAAWIGKLLYCDGSVRVAQDYSRVHGIETFIPMMQQCLEARRPKLILHPDGTRETVRHLLASCGATTVIRSLKRPNGERHQEITYENWPNVDASQLQDMADQFTVGALQQLDVASAVRDTYFDKTAGTTHVMTLKRDGDTIAERPLHLAENYAGLTKRLAHKCVFEPKILTNPTSGATERQGDRDVNTQEAQIALWKVAREYRTSYGYVPGVLQWRVRDELTARKRRRDVARKRPNGTWRTLGEIEHSGDRTLAHSDPHRTDAVDEETSDLLARIADRRPNPEESLAAREHAERFAAQLSALPRSQRTLASLLLHGSTRADAAVALGCSRANITQTLKRMPAAVRVVLIRLADDAE